MLVSQAIKINKNYEQNSKLQRNFIFGAASLHFYPFRVIINIIQVNLDFTKSRKCTKYGDIFHVIWPDRYKKTTLAETVFILK